MWIIKVIVISESKIEKQKKGIWILATKKSIKGKVIDRFKKCQKTMRHLKRTQRTKPKKNQVRTQSQRNANHQNKNLQRCHQVIHRNLRIILRRNCKWFNLRNLFWINNILNLKIWRTIISLSGLIFLKFNPPFFIKICLCLKKIQEKNSVHLLWLFLGTQLIWVARLKILLVKWKEFVDHRNILYRKRKTAVVILQSSSFKISQNRLKNLNLFSTVVEVSEGVARPVCPPPPSQCPRPSQKFLVFIPSGSVDSRNSINKHTHIHTHKGNKGKDNKESKGRKGGNLRIVLLGARFPSRGLIAFLLLTMLTLSI